MNRIFNPITMVALVASGLMILGGCDSKPAQSGGTAANKNSAGVVSPGESTKTSGAAAPVNTELAGSIDIDGSSTVYPISEAASASFVKQFPGVKPSVGKSGTGGGFKRFVVGEIDISDASRPITADEFQACQKNSVAFIELPIAYDGLTIVVNPKNKFCESLTVEQLKQIFLADGEVKTWKDVNAEWPDKEIRFFVPGTDSGTFDYFKEVVAGKTGSIRGGMSTSEEDNVLVNGVAGDEFAIGFFGVSYFEQNTDKLRAVPVVNPGTGKPVMPTAETIENGSYALFSRPLFIYLNSKSVNKPQVERFVQYYLENAASLARATGYVALPDSVYEQARNNFLDEVTGTHWLTAEMEKRGGPVTDVFKPENLSK